MKLVPRLLCRIGLHDWRYPPDRTDLDWSWRERWCIRCALREALPDSWWLR